MAFSFIYTPRNGFLPNQLNGAALSIAANIAEGNGRVIRPDRNNGFFTLFTIDRDQCEIIIVAVEIIAANTHFLEHNPFCIRQFYRNRD